MATRSTSLAQYLLNQWRTTQDIGEELYEQPLDDRKLRAARQALSRLRDAVDRKRWPLDIPAGKALVLDERWEKKSDGHGSEKCFRLRIQDARGEVRSAGESSAYLQLWFPPSSWSGWIVPGFRTLERDRSISHKHLYTEARGPDNWLTVASSPIYKDAERLAGRAVYDELYGAAGDEWASGDLVYVGLGTGSGLADVRVLREVLEQDRSRRVRAVPLDFSPVLLSEAVANIYQELTDEIEAGRLSVHPILGDLEQPRDWAKLLPPIEEGASLVVGMFGNTIGHLQYRERNTLQAVMDALDGWAQRNRCPRWTGANSRFLLGISLQRKDGAPHGRTEESCRRWMNLISDPLTTLLETVEGEYALEVLPHESWEEEDGRTAVGALRVRRAPRKGDRVGRIWHEELPYKPSDGITGVVQRYVFTFDEDLRIEGRQVFERHHLPASRWQAMGDLEASFRGGEDQIVLAEVTQFSLKSFRPALRRLGMAHGEQQVHVMKVGNTRPYAVLVFHRG